MVAYVFTNNVITIFELARAVITLNYVGHPVDHVGNMVTITTSDGLPNYGESPPRETPQLAIPVQASALVYFLTYQEARGPKAPITIQNFYHPWSRKSKNNLLQNQFSQGALQESNKVAIFR